MWELMYMFFCVYVCRADNPYRKHVGCFGSEELHHAILNPVTLSYPLCLTFYCTLTTQATGSYTVHRVHRPSDMNRGYNLLAFPHGGYLIREKGGVDTREDNGPSEALNEGGREREVQSWEDKIGGTHWPKNSAGKATWGNVLVFAFLV